jgi:adenylate cyclase
VERDHVSRIVTGALGRPSGPHTSEATVGYIGSERRSEYTAIGDTINVSSRLESHAKAGEILLSEGTRNAAGDLPYVFVPREPIRVKNRDKPIKIFEVERD